MARITIDHWSLGHHEYGWNQGANSADGWSLYLSYTVSADKAVNYIVFEVTPIDPVGGTAHSQIAGISTIPLKAIGPISTTSENIGLWKNVWYISYPIIPKFNGAIIYYADGTTEIISTFIIKDYSNNVEYFYQKEYSNNNNYSNSNNNASTSLPSSCATLIAIAGFFLLLIIIIFSRH